MTECNRLFKRLADAEHRALNRQRRKSPSTGRFISAKRAGPSLPSLEQKIDALRKLNEAALTSLPHNSAAATPAAAGPGQATQPGPAAEQLQPAAQLFTRAAGVTDLPASQATTLTQARSTTSDAELRNVNTQPMIPRWSLTDKFPPTDAKHWLLANRKPLQLCFAINGVPNDGREIVKMTAAVAQLFRVSTIAVSLETLPRYHEPMDSYDASFKIRERFSNRYPHPAGREIGPNLLAYKVLVVKPANYSNLLRRLTYRAVGTMEDWAKMVMDHDNEEVSRELQAALPQWNGGMVEYKSFQNKDFGYIYASVPVPGIDTPTIVFTVGPGVSMNYAGQEALL